MSFFKSDEQKLEQEQKKQALLRQNIIDKEQKLAEKKELQQAKQKTKAMYDIMKVRRPWQFRKLYRKMFWRLSKIMLIHMELNNGFHAQFIVRVSGDMTFMYDKKTYLIDESFKYYDIASKLWCLDYHESLAIPIRRKVPINEIKNISEMKGISDVENALNPLILRQWQQSSVVEKILKGAEMDSVFKFLKAITVFMAIVGAITLILMVQMSGLLQGII